MLGSRIIWPKNLLQLIASEQAQYRSVIDRSIIGDEKWVPYDNSYPKWQGLLPNEPGSYSRKALLSVWLSIGRVIGFAGLKLGQTVKEDLHCEQFE